MNAIDFSRSVRPDFEDGPSPEPVLALSSLGQALRRRWAVAVLLFVLLSLAAAATILSLPRWYTAEALVLFQSRQTQVSDLQAFSNGVGHDPNFIKTQADLIGSRATAAATVAALGLGNRAEFQPRPGIIGAALAQLGLREGAPAPTPEQRATTATDTLLGRIRVTSDLRSNVVRLAVEAQSPELAAELANGMVQQVIAAQAAAKRAALARTQAWFAEQVDELAQKLRSAEAAVEQYRAQHGLTEGGGASGGRGGTVTASQLAELSSQLTQAVAERVRREALQADMQGILRGSVRADSLPAVVDAPLVQRLLDREAGLAAREAELASVFGPQHPDLVAARAQLRSVRAEKAAAIRNMTGSLSSAAAAARENEERLRQRVEALRRQAQQEAQLDAELRRLVAEADAQRMVYSTFLGRVGQLANSAAIQEPNAELVSAATPPTGPSFPKRAPLLLFALVGSLAASLGGALVADWLARGYRDAAELEADLDITVLGVLPEVQLWGGPMPHKGYSRRLRDGARTILNGITASPCTGCRVVVISSARAREGRTTLAISLAVMAAAAKLRVTLVDANLGERAAPNWPGATASVGLSACLAAEEAAELPQRAEGSPLLLLPAGGAVPDPARLLTSERMTRLVARLRLANDLVIIDAPAMTDPAAVLALAREADELVLAMRWLGTQRRQARDTLRQLGAAGAPLTGAVLTRVALR